MLQVTVKEHRDLYISTHRGQELAWQQCSLLLLFTSGCYSVLTGVISKVSVRVRGRLRVSVIRVSLSLGVRGRDSRLSVRTGGRARVSIVDRISLQLGIKLVKELPGSAGAPQWTRASAQTLHTLQECEHVQFVITSVLTTSASSVQRGFWDTARVPQGPHHEKLHMSSPQPQRIQFYNLKFKRNVHMWSSPQTSALPVTMTDEECQQPYVSWGCSGCFTDLWQLNLHIWAL